MLFTLGKRLFIYNTLYSQTNSHIFIGIDSQFGTLEGAVTSIVDMKLFPNLRKEILTGLTHFLFILYCVYKWNSNSLQNSYQYLHSFPLLCLSLSFPNIRCHMFGIYKELQLFLSDWLQVLFFCWFQFQISFFISLMFCNGSGNYIFTLFDDFAGNFPLLIVAFCECIAVSYVYGLKKLEILLHNSIFINNAFVFQNRFSDEIELMTGRRVNHWFLFWFANYFIFINIINTFWYAINIQ